MGEKAKSRKLWVVTGGIIAIVIILGAYLLVTQYFTPRPPLGEIKEIKVGLVLALTGEVAEAGNRMKMAFELAAKEINDAGGVLGVPIHLIIEDDGGGAAGVDKTILAVTKLITNDKVDFISGIYSSSSALAAEDLAGRYKKIFLITEACSARITQAVLDDYQTNKYVFDTAMNTTVIGNLMAQGADALFNASSYMFIGTDYAFCHDVADGIRALAPQLGLTNLGEMYTGWDVIDYTSEIAQIQQKDPDVVFHAIQGAGPIHGFFGGWYTKQPRAIICSDCMPEMLDPALLPLMPHNGDYLTCINCITKAAITNKTLPFYAAYKAFTGKYEPLNGFDDAFNYDGLYILADAIKRAGTLDTDAVITALEATDYIGTIGRYVFTKSHSPLYAPGYIEGVLVQNYQMQTQIIWPASLATAQYLPPWSKD